MKQILFFTILLLLSACSPRYEIKTHYTLPSDAQGRICVQTCSNERKICQAHCNMRQEQCLERTKKSAENAFASTMNEYQDVLNEYHHEMDRYNFEMSSWQREERRVHQDFEHYRRACRQGKKNSYECRRSYELDNQLSSLENHEPMAPQRPIKPTLSEEIRRAQKGCNNSCGCEKEYDSCFISCGGKLHYEKFCVANCK